LADEGKAGSAVARKSRELKESSMMQKAIRGLLYGLFHMCTILNSLESDAAVSKNLDFSMWNIRAHLSFPNRNDAAMNSGFTGAWSLPIWINKEENRGQRKLLPILRAKGRARLRRARVEIEGRLDRSHWLRFHGRYLPLDACLEAPRLAILSGLRPAAVAHQKLKAPWRPHVLR
jgi:hypothetical protein